MKGWDSEAWCRISRPTYSMYGLFCTQVGEAGRHSSETDGGWQQQCMHSIIYWGCLGSESLAAPLLLTPPLHQARAKVKVKVGKSLHRLNFPVLTSSFRPLFDLPDAPSAVPPTSSEWVPGRPVPKPWRF